MGDFMTYQNKDVWQQYKEKLCTADEAVRCIKSGDWITYAFFNGKPVACDIALAKRKDELKDVHVYGAVTIPPIPEVLTQDTTRGLFVQRLSFFSPHPDHENAVS